MDYILQTHLMNFNILEFYLCVASMSKKILCLNLLLLYRTVNLLDTHLRPQISQQQNITWCAENKMVTVIKTFCSSHHSAK